MTPGARIEERLARRGGTVELLRVPASLFGLVTALRGALYERGWFRAERLDAPVVCVGNLTAGGTGKTPMVAYLARELLRRERRPGILSRGFGAPSGASESGQPENDEARLLARVLPDVPHVQDPDRVRGGRELVAKQVDVVLLDDGFQHRRLHRDVDLVLVDATRPWGLPATDGGEPVRALLPRGLLREHPRGLARAQAIVITRSDQVEAAAREDLKEELQRWAPGVPVLAAVHRPSALGSIDGDDSFDLERLDGREVELVSAIGNPDAFERTVTALGARVASHRRFPDHHLYTPADLRELGQGGRLVLTTAKDAVKIAGLAPSVTLPGIAFRSLEVELELCEGAPVLEALLDALPESRFRRERAALHEGIHG